MSTPTRTSAPANGPTKTRPKAAAKVKPAPARAPRDAPDPHPNRRRTLLWVVAALTVIVVVVAIVVSSPLLDIEEITVVGVAPERTVEVRTASGLGVGDPILTFLPGRVAGKVRDLPWVATASVTRHYPKTVEITVTERQPVGWVKAGSRVLVVDKLARVLWRADLAPSGLPELVGVADVAPPGGTIRPVVVAAVADALGPDLRGRSAAVTLDDGSIVVRVAGGPELRFGAPTGIAVKARVAAAVLATLGANPAAYIDVTVPAAPVSG